MSRAKRPDTEDVFDNDLDITSRSVWLSADITKEAVTSTIKGLTILMGISAEPVKLFINSEGGDMTQGFALIDFITRCVSTRMEVTGIVQGEAMSAALVILQACSTRIATQNSVLMAHGGNRSTEFDLRIDMKADALLLEKMQQVNPALTMTKFQKWQMHDKYLMADEALALGLVDRVV